MPQKNPPDWSKTPRLYLPAALAEGQTLPLAPDQTHYLRDVMRLQSGDPLRVFNAEQGEYAATISASSKRSLEITLHENLRPPASQQNLTLCCAPIKKAHFDFLVMKATELGIAELQPMLTARTQIRDINIERSQAIATEAAEQSERLTIPTINPPRTLEQIVATWSGPQRPIICAEFGEAQPVAQAFSDPTLKNASAAFFTGPEGGFTPAEMHILCQLPKNVKIRLGPRILRADTAVLAALSCWQALCGDWN